MRAEPRIRVSAILVCGGRLLLCRHEKDERAYWLLPGGGVNSGESLREALVRELWEECGIPSNGSELRFEGPVAIADSIAPEGSESEKHIVHLIFATDLDGHSLDGLASQDEAVRGHQLFELEELDAIVLHPPIQHFLQRWQPGQPSVYLGSLWAP